MLFGIKKSKGEIIMTDLVQKIRAFISENFLFDEEIEFENDDSFLDQGIIDSTGVLELVAWVEETFSIEVNDMELNPENLDSIDKLATFIQTKIK
jgi:acyl carrier protein